MASSARLAVYVPVFEAANEPQFLHHASGVMRLVRHFRWSEVTRRGVCHSSIVPASGQSANAHAMGCNHDEATGRICLDHAPDFLKTRDPSGYSDIVQAKQDDAKGREAISKHELAKVLVGCEDQALLGLGER